MVSVFINNKEYEVPEHFTILQACEFVGVQIPRFCYHESLSIAGNCRMCLVELKNAVKPVASCAMNVSPGMIIWTNTLLVKKAREGVMEFLLANHPLDCPICDQGGECDLQDQAMLFGNDRGRFYDTKRSVSNKECGPFIKTIMTRCIHCTRCVRFSGELGGVPELGTTGRGSSTEIGNYVSKAIVSEVSGNLIDLCPVGALTSKPYAFKARPWELKKTETIDTLDSMGSNIVMQASGKEVLRVLPVLHEGINDSWITDRTRFCYDAFSLQRLTQPYTLNKNKRGLSSTNWKTIFFNYLIGTASLLGKKKTFVVGQGLSLENSIKLGNYAKSCNMAVVDESLPRLSIDFRSLYSFNSLYKGFSNTDLCVIIGADLQGNLPLLALRLRKEQRLREVQVLVFGNAKLDGVRCIRGGNSLNSIIKLIEGKHKLCGLVQKAKSPMLLVGDGVSSLGYNAVIASLHALFQKAKWDGFNFLLQGSSSYQLAELGLSSPLAVSKKHNVSVYNTYGVGLSQKAEGVGYFSSHGSMFSKEFSEVFPLALAAETEGLYLNNEGRPQYSKFVITPPNGVRESGSVFKALKLFSENKVKKSSKLTKDLQLIGSVIVNESKYGDIQPKYNTVPDLVSNVLVSSEFGSVLGEDYLSKSSRHIMAGRLSALSVKAINYRL